MNMCRKTAKHEKSLHLSLGDINRGPLFPLKQHFSFDCPTAQNISSKPKKPIHPNNIMKMYTTLFAALTFVAYASAGS